MLTHNKVHLGLQKLKLFLCTPSRQMWVWRCSSMHSLPYNQMEVRGQLFTQAALTFRESDPITYGAGWCMGPRTNLDTWVERKISYSYREFNYNFWVIYPIAWAVHWLHLSLALEFLCICDKSLIRFLTWTTCKLQKMWRALFGLYELQLWNVQ